MLGKACAAPTGLGALSEYGPTAAAVGYDLSSLAGLRRGASQMEDLERDLVVGRRCRTLAVFKGAGFRARHSIRFIDRFRSAPSRAEEGSP